MLRIKDTKVFSEINEFFTDNNNPVFQIMDRISELKLKIRTPKQSKYDRRFKLFHLLIGQLMGMCTVHQYLKGFERWTECKKDVLYRFKSNGNINWRIILNRINKKLIQNQESMNTHSNESTKCLIIDDTDFEKRGSKMEFIGRIFNHVKKTYNLGYKCLNLCYWNGNSCYGLDFSIHIETGRNPAKQQGLSKMEQKQRFSKLRADNSPGHQRQKELVKSKISMAIQMLKGQLKQGIKANYLLADSWFTCVELIQAVIKFPGLHYLGMAKIGKTKYELKGKFYTASQLINKMKRNKSYSRKLKMQYLTVRDAKFKNIPVKIFFYKTSRSSSYQMLITTHNSLDAVKAFSIYRIRWSIELFYKESKQHLNLGKSQSIDFDTQIADTTISIITYNLLSSIRSLNEYKSIGGLFEQISKNNITPNLIDRINELLEQILEILVEVLQVDIYRILDEKLSSPDFDNKYLKTFLKLAS